MTKGHKQGAMRASRFFMIQRLLLKRLYFWLVQFSKTEQKQFHMHTNSPFPGMDPFLEGHIWPDVHNRLINAISEILAPKIAPKYVARVETYTVEDTNPESEVGITYPDVAVLRRRVEQAPVAAYTDTTVMTEPDLMVSTSVTVHIPVIQIRDIEKNRLITCIEILSPVNKRSPGWQPYHEKRNDLHLSGVHLLEIDLLRRGKRHVPNLGLPEHHYLFTLWRTGTGKMAVWANSIQQPLPILPVPLNSPDPDVLLPLKQALDMIYQRGMYQLSIDYAKEPAPPEFSEDDKNWMRQLIQA